MRRVVRLLGASALALLAGAGALAQEQVAPAPAGTIYPGEIIRADMLRATSYPGGVTANVLLTPEQIVGKVARRTLLAGRPIVVEAVAEPQALANGALVQIVFDQGGINITAPGQALHAGSVGEAVRVRNVDTGAVVTGVLTREGTVRVGG